MVRHRRTQGIQRGACPGTNALATPRPSPLVLTLPADPAQLFRFALEARNDNAQKRAYRCQYRNYGRDDVRRRLLRPRNRFNVLHKRDNPL